MGASSLDAQAASGPLERARKNVSALRVLRELEESGRAPSADEVAALGAYSGWGGAQEAFSDRPDTGPWRTLRASLEDVLKEEDYAAARASTLTAFYTPGPVIEAMWEALRDVGVGRLGHATVLEPGCGTGNFMRSVPGGMDVSVVGVEVDPTSARIASALARPGNQVVNAALEDCAIPDGSFDAVIGNVPYSDSIRVEDRGRAVPIHDYFVSRALDAVRPGGVVALLTSRYTLDKASSATREELAKRAELVGVARLPEETFEAQAGTSVISDVLFLRRRARALDEVPSEAREWLETGSLGESDGSGPRVSRALLDHPERVIGELSVGSGPFGPTLAVHAPGVTGGPLKDALARALARQLGPRAQEIRASLPKRLAAPVVAVRPRKVDAFELTLADDGSIWYGSGDEVVPFEPRSAGDLPRVRAMLCLRDESRALLSAEADPSFSDDEVEGRIGALDRHYDEFVARYGHLADAANRRALRQNVFQDATVATTLLSLEDTRQGRFSSKASMLERRVITPAPPMPERAESASDAVAISIDQTGGLDTPLVARLLGVSEDALDDALGDLSVRDPDSGALMLAAEYLSGDVVGKLEHVRALIRREEDGGREAREASWRRTLALPDHLSADRDLMERVSAAVRSLRESGLYQTALQPLSSPTVTLTDRFSEPSIAHALGTYDSDQRRYALDRVLSDAERGKDGGLAGFEVIRNLLDGALDGRYDTVWSPGKDTPSRPSWALWRTLSAVSQNRDQLSSLVDGVLARHRRPRPCVVALHVALGMESVSVELRRTGGRGDSSALVETLLAHPHVTEYVYLLEGEGRLRDASPEGLASFECRRADAVGGVTIDQGRMSFLQTLKGRLEAACPRRIGHEDIAAQLGSAWIPPVVVLRFMRDLFKIDVTSMTESELKRWSVTHDTVTGRWQVTGSSSALLGPVAREFGIEQYPCHKLVESLLNGSQLRCTKPDPDDFNKRVADPVATARAWEKRSKIEQAFRDWVWKDPAQARMLEDVYNRRFNRTVNRRYDGSALTFPGMAEGIRLRSHQADAVARVLESEEGTLLGHVVGAGKTFEAVAAMHEARRLGRATKPMAVVPNHLTGQFASEWLRMYPDAKLLVMDDSDTRSPEAAQRFWGRARAGEWDAVIVGHSRFSKLALSPEIQERATQARLDELKDSIEAGRKSEGRQSFTVKAQEGLRKRLERQLRDLQARKGADELGISFDELGVDMLVVDEAVLVAIHDLDCPWRPSDLEQRLGRIVRQGNENGLVYDFRYVTKGTFDAYMYQTVERKQRFIAQTFTSATPARTVDDLDPVQLDYAEVKALATGDPNVAARLSLENEVRQLELSRRAFEQGRSEVKDAIVSRLEPKASLLRERHDLLAAHQDAFAQALASEPPTREAAQLAAQALLSAPSGPTRSVIGDYRGLQVVAELRPGLLAEDPPIRYVGLMPKEEADLYRAHMARSPMPLSAEGPHTVLHQLNSIIEADARGGELVRDDLERAEADLADAERMAEEPWAQEVEWREKRGRLEALMHVDRVGTEEAPSAEEVRASVRAARLSKDDPSPVRRPDPNSRTW